MSENNDKPAVMTRPIPSPAVSIETQPFWEAAKEGRFLVPRCRSCDAHFWYPRQTCPTCLGGDVEWTESPGEGVIYTYSVMHRSPTGPYALGYVTLDEGVNVLTNFVDVAPDGLSIGMRVKVRFQETEGGGPPAPVFAPA